MFQTPVNNLEKIRKARKRVKQLLLQIGLETCRDAFEEINTYNPGDTHLSSTSWEDVSLWEAFGRRNGYRSKQFCCSLCKFSTRLLSSFKSHLQRYHEDEKDQELMSACPSCPFTSQTKNVVKHMRIFHSSVRKVQSAGGKESPNNTINSVRFSCAKCNFTDTLYYSLKRHVLMTHHQAELENYFGDKSEEVLKSSSVFKITPDSRYYCKKCSCITSNRDALMYHILTSDKHRDLELKLRTDISDVSRPHVRRPYKKFTSSGVAHLPKPPVLVSNTTPPATQDVKVISLPQNGPNPSLLGTPNPPIQKIVPVSTVADTAGGLGPTITTTLAPTAQVGFVTAQLPQNQSITLQASLPQSVFLSPRFPVNQPVTATVLPSGGQVIPGTQAGMRSAVLPINQTLALNQSAVLTCPQSFQSAVINMNPAVRSTMFPVNQSVRPNNIAGNQPGIPQNAILTAPILRQLIPTGKQVNGIPTYTLAPISVTLPVAPCAIPAVNPPKVPIQLSQPDKVIQVSTSPASAPSPPVVQLAQTVSQKHAKSTAAKSLVSPTALGKEAKQWKTCPVCSELFPSNVYEVHMQIAHIKQENSPSKPTKSSTTNEAKETVVIAAQASFLKVVKENSIRCVICKTFTHEDEVLKHLLMHGMVCLYCKAVFFELRNFIYHMKILHVGKKKLHRDFVKKGLTISSDANGDALFPHFDFTCNVSRDELGDRDMHLAVVTGANANTATPIYIKIQCPPEACGPEDQQASKCPFCNCALSKSEVYETHLKEKHHIMPTVHTILKTPAFKCIHCCGVYTGNMTLSAISVHLQRCRNAPKDSTSGAELLSENNVGAKQRGSEYVKTKQNATGDAQGALQESKNHYKSGPTSKDPGPSKRRRLDIKTDPSESLDLLQSIDLLEMLPDASATVSHESKKEFLTKYFHKKPYPSKKEIELLSAVLEMWKSDVASFFGTKRYICLKFLRNHKQRVMLGFKMAELKKVQHDVDLQEDY